MVIVCQKSFLGFRVSVCQWDFRRVREVVNRPSPQCLDSVLVLVEMRWHQYCPRPLIVDENWMSEGVGLVQQQKVWLRFVGVMR